MLIILCNLQFEGYFSPCPEFSLTLSPAFPPVRAPLPPAAARAAGRSGVWRSWLAHLVWDQRVVCSSHITPTGKAGHAPAFSVG